jgi:hypothetical protein
MRNKDSSSTPARNPHWLVRLVGFFGFPHTSDTPKISPNQVPPPKPKNRRCEAYEGDHIGGEFHPVFMTTRRCKVCGRYFDL